jgi:hypothetical protein
MLAEWSMCSSFQSKEGSKMNTVLEKPEFKTWKTIKIGTRLKTPYDFREALESAGMKIGDWAYDIMCEPAFTVITGKKEFELVVVTVAELGFKDGATRKDIYARAKKLGLNLCPPEIGPRLRLKYTDQPMNDFLVIAMKAIKGLDGIYSLFYLKHNVDGLWLISEEEGAPAVKFWKGGNDFVFLRRK